MKPILAILVSVLLAVPAFAQVELGINGGIIKNTSSTDFYNDGNGHWINKSSESRPVISVAGMYNVKDWRFGILVGCQQQKFSYTEVLPVGCFGSETRTTAINEKLVPLNLSASRKLVFHCFEAYGGVSVGTVIKMTNFRVESSDAHDTYVSHTYGVAGGVHAGMTWFVSKHIGINAEGGAYYMNVSSYPIEYGQISFPMTVGVRYRF